MVERKPQLAYSDLQVKMLDETQRRTKARKIISVLHQHLGRTDLNGLTAADIGCSTGFTADELSKDGASTTGLDIDEPGLKAAQERFGDRIQFVCRSGDDLPFNDESLDIVVFNHIYEHVVDPDAVLTEIHRVLKPDGVAYLGLGNKFQIVEPHYKLPFLSWLPQGLADGYMRRSGKGDQYYENHLSRAGLKRLVRGFRVWDYTIPVIVRPGTFNSDDQVNGAIAKLPPGIVRAALPIVPTFIWVATKSGGVPASSIDGVAPEFLDLTTDKR